MAKYYVTLTETIAVEAGDESEAIQIAEDGGGQIVGREGWAQAAYPQDQR